MKLGECVETEIECEAGGLHLRAWAKDEAGNRPFLALNAFGGDGGFAHLTMKETKALTVALMDMLREMEQSL